MESKKCHFSAGPLKMGMILGIGNTLMLLWKIMDRNVNKIVITSFSSKWSNNLIKPVFRDLKCFTI